MSGPVNWCLHGDYQVDRQKSHPHTFAVSHRVPYAPFQPAEVALILSGGGSIFWPSAILPTAAAP